MCQLGEALEAVQQAVQALRGMSGTWACAAGYADALEARMPLVGRPGPSHARSSSSSFSLHTPSASLGLLPVPVPAVVVNTDDGADNTHTLRRR